ncbi:DUF4817 domain-containing protein [Trichonephila clavipes]|uniref:DUF4817 domain-containing protein n=1 Tax=Trichonephila clavipes TaxID=2585209 RepID=A0A8X6W5N7_TRICX|nr:DUF4817 domain-containing protein [Trichonephila clavipes]
MFKKLPIDGAVGQHIPAKNTNMHDKRKMLLLPQSDKHCRMPTLPERALLVKLYYCNSKNAAAAVRISPSQEAMTWTDVGVSSLKHDGKIREIRQLGVLPGRGRKRVNTAVVEDITTAVVEASSESLYGAVSVWTISRTLGMAYSTVRHIMRKILNFYP